MGVTHEAPKNLNAACAAMDGSLGQVAFSSCDHLHLRAGEGRCLVELSILVTHDGLVAYLFGGDRTHVGAAAVSFPGVDSEATGSTSCETHVIPRTGHRDDIIARQVCEKLSLALGVAVFVAAGIHIEGAEKPEIESILANCAKVGDLAARTLKSRVR